MSTNPYAQPVAGTAAPETSPEKKQLADYELAVGPNRDYYVPRFEEFDRGGSQMSWHWPAFFVTSPWFLYRKMYAVGVLNLVQRVRFHFHAPLRRPLGTGCDERHVVHCGGQPHPMFRLSEASEFATA